MSHIKPPLSNIKLPLSDIKPTMSHIKLPLSDIKPTMSHIKPALSHIKPTMSHIKPPLSDIKPTMSHIKPQSSTPKQTPISNIQYPNSNIQYPNSKLQYPISKLQYPISNIQYPISNIQYPISKPHWLKVRLPNNKSYTNVKQIVSEHKLHTICESGNCPNIGECWGAGTATFLILGDICTRSCRFCAVKTGKPFPPDLNEPQNVANSIKLMNLKHCVITSVDRDDLPDSGANHWAKTINKIRAISPSTTIETLIPDFNGNTKLLDIIIKEKPEIVSHNLETVNRLTREVRIKAKYSISLEVLKYLSNHDINTKTGIMLGLGETEEEIYETMDDILKTGCKIITIGQYLQPTSLHLPVQKFSTPEEFNKYHEVAINKGFKIAECAPLVRSSYHAEKHI